ncbi:MAG: uroporphyrinogen decarboxylase family protein [Candidatus Bathyarchaeia archaeon]
MNSRERVLKTLEIEEPDRLPIMEIEIEPTLMEMILGKKYSVATSTQTQVLADREKEKLRNDFKIECYRKIGFDVCTADLSAPEYWRPKVNPDGTMIDLWGRILLFDGETKQWVPYSTIFNTPEDFEKFQLPDPNAEGWMFATEYLKRKVGDDMATATVIRDPFAHVWEMFTPIKFVRWMYENPQLIRRAIDKITEFNITIIKRIGEASPDFIISAGDYCEVKGPMVPTRFFREVIFPNLKRQVDAAHKAGLKLIKHTDGNINPILDDMAGIVDGLHSLDPSAGVDIGEVKAKYGSKLVLIGNVSVDNLARKNKAEIIEEVKSIIKRVSPGGGHILSSSNTWAAGAKLDNCLAMVEAGRRYGIYPIRI